MRIAQPTTPELAPPEFETIRALVYQVAGIRLHSGKLGLVRTRLTRRLRELGLADFPGYLSLLTSSTGEEELPRMVEALTTNKTSFFRESGHFHYISDTLAPRWSGEGGAVRIWSAGCSTGEEPYSLAMLLREPLGGRARILATDISQRVLDQARGGVYSSDRVEAIPPALRQVALVPSGKEEWAVRPAVRSAVQFARLNLMDPWPMRGPFQAIFCRNVMIYFDRPTQERLVGRFAELLAPGGHLFIGHAESLTGLRHPFSYLQPALYAKD